MFGTGVVAWSTVLTDTHIFELFKLFEPNEVLQHLRNPGMIPFPCKCQGTAAFPGFTVQDFVHPQYRD